MAKILIVDDEKNAREGLLRALSYKYDIETVESAEQAFELIKQKKYDIVVTDLRMPGMNGMDFIKKNNSLENPPLVILQTAYGSVQTAIEAIRNGAYDYLTKPFNLENLEMVIDRGLESRRLQSENEQLRQQLDKQAPFEGIIGQSDLMQKIFENIKQVADTKTTILLTGESGTGKELVAKAIHRFGNRKMKPFIAVHCAALSENLLESELFGHEKGAFTGANEKVLGRFESADGGTLFLDEIGEINASVQVKLLRVLETRSFQRVGGNNNVEVDVRLIVATNKNLGEEVVKGNFREDLYYRLNVVNLHLPSLRERSEDIPFLLEHYLTIFCKENAKSITGFTPEAVNVLKTYSWPGNVRELRNCVERMVVMTRGTMLSMQDIPIEIQLGLEQSLSQEKDLIPSVGLDVAENEKRLIKVALENCRGNRSKAAEQLGISRRTLYRKLEDLGIGKK